MEKRMIARVDEAVVLAEPTPQFTDTWRPYSHAQVLDVMEHAVKQAGLQVVRKEYTLRKSSQMFATWELADVGGPEYNLGIVIINSIDKSRSVTLSVFEKMFVCSNFMFRLAQERIMFRRHSGRLVLAELQFLAKKALDILISKFRNIAQWHEGLKNRPISSSDAALLAIAAARRGIIPTTFIQQFFEMFQGSSSKYKQWRGSMFAWHGAATELMKNDSFNLMARKQDELNYFIDYEGDEIQQAALRGIPDLEAARTKAFAHYQIDRHSQDQEMKRLNAEIRRAWDKENKV